MFVGFGQVLDEFYIFKRVCDDKKVIGFPFYKSKIEKILEFNQEINIFMLIQKRKIV